MKTITSDALASYSPDMLSVWQKQFRETGILIFPQFLESAILEEIQDESREISSEAYTSSTGYNLFVDDANDNNPAKKRLSQIQFDTKKSCICYDSISPDSPLKNLYHNPEFQGLMCKII